MGWGRARLLLLLPHGCCCHEGLGCYCRCCEQGACCYEGLGCYCRCVAFAAAIGARPACTSTWLLVLLLLLLLLLPAWYQVPPGWVYCKAHKVDDLHPAPYPPAPSTLHPTPCILHPAPCSPHPAPCPPHHVADRFYDKAHKIDALDFFKQFGVSPEDLPDTVFASIGRTVWRDIGPTAICFRMLTKVGGEGGGGTHGHHIQNAGGLLDL